MQTIGVREFRDQATTLMASGETLVIERRGEPIGFFVPLVAKDRAEGRAALGRLGEVVAEVLSQADVTEDELVSELTAERSR